MRAGWLGHRASAPLARIRSLREQAGGSLVGEVVSIAIVGAALMIFIGGLSAGSRGVSYIEQRVTAGNLARQQMDAIQEAAYSADPTAVPYPTLAAPPGYALQVDIAHWVLSTGSFTTTLPAQDGCLQEITVTAKSTRGAGQTLVVLEDYKADLTCGD